MYYITQFKTTEPVTQLEVEMRVGIVSPSKERVVNSLQESFDARDIQIIGEFSSESAPALNYLAYEALQTVNLN